MFFDKKIVSFVFTALIIGLLFLSGPVAAVTVSLTSPSSVAKGSNITFTIKVDINNPDTYLPVKYTNIIISGPGGFSKICKVNMDGTDDCSDVSVSVSVDDSLGYGFGSGYGYDSATGYGYDFGYGYGYNLVTTSGSITYTLILDTTGLNIGAYTAQADSRSVRSAGGSGLPNHARCQHRPEERRYE